MLRVIRSGVFITLMQALLLVGLFEVFFGNNYTPAGVVAFELVVGSIGLALGIAAIRCAPARRKLRRR